jgi:Acyclic terpene utilisation family protein AtuA
MATHEQFRLGTGAGFSADRLDPAVDLVAKGRLDAIVFECIGERTLAFGHRDRMADPTAGYNPLLERRLRAILPLCFEHGTRLITNMGVANARGAAARAAQVARDLGLRGLKIAALEGDDVGALIGPDTPLSDSGMTVGETGRQLVGANAYLGADAILPALEADAAVVITGRVADPSLFLAPLCHAFGWADDDWPMLGAGTLVGHLMECAAQITGGYFADPGFKDVPNLAYVGFPIAEVAADGRAVITKLADAGGLVSARTVKEQLLYEVHDPSAYVTPDVIADFSRVQIGEDGPDRVAVGGAHGKPRPAQLKVTVAFDGGLLAEAGVSYAGPGEGARRAGRRDRPGTHARPARLQRPAAHQSDRGRRPARQRDPVPERCPGRAPARSAAGGLPRAGRASAVGGGVAAVLRPRRRRRLSRPDHAVGDHAQRLHRPGQGAAAHRNPRDMTRGVPLRQIAHARAGDKGDRSNIAVFVYEPKHYATVKAQLTPERLRTEFGGLLRGPIRRFALDHLGALNFVMDEALEGGVNESLNLDAHGKSWSFLLLGLEIAIEE